MFIITLSEKFSSTAPNKNNSHSLRCHLIVIFAFGYYIQMIPKLTNVWESQASVGLEELIAISGLCKRNVKVYGQGMHALVHRFCTFLALWTLMIILKPWTSSPHQMYIYTHLNILCIISGGFMDLWSASKESQSWVKDTGFQICYSVALTVQEATINRMCTLLCFFRRSYYATVKASKHHWEYNLQSHRGGEKSHLVAEDLDSPSLSSLHFFNTWSKLLKVTKIGLRLRLRKKCKDLYLQYYHFHP